MIKFTDQRGLPVGTALLDRGRLVLDGVAVQLRETPHGKAQTPEEFYARYAEWSNGYLSSHEVEDKEAGQGPGIAL